MIRSNNLDLGKTNSLDKKNKKIIIKIINNKFNLVL